MNFNHLLGKRQLEHSQQFPIRQPQSHHHNHEPQDQQSQTRNKQLLYEPEKSAFSIRNNNITPGEVE